MSLLGIGILIAVLHQVITLWLFFLERFAAELPVRSTFLITHCTSIAFIVFATTPWRGLSLSR